MRLYLSRLNLVSQKCARGESRVVELWDCSCLISSNYQYVSEQLGQQPLDLDSRKKIDWTHAPIWDDRFTIESHPRPPTGYVNKRQQKILFQSTFSNINGRLGVAAYGLQMLISAEDFIAVCLLIKIQCYSKIATAFGSNFCISNKASFRILFSMVFPSEVNRKGVILHSVKILTEFAKIVLLMLKILFLKKLWTRHKSTFPQLPPMHRLGPKFGSLSFSYSSTFMRCTLPSKFMVLHHRREVW